MKGPESPPSLEWVAAGGTFYSANFFYQKKFGEKVWKLSLDAGCGCPNRDGTLGTGGCVFCDPASFSPSRRLQLPRISEQIEAGIRQVSRRVRVSKYIAYFQPGTNTYGPFERLRDSYSEALSHPQIVGLIVGTRPDCVPDGILDLLAELSERTFLVVEYGLQTIHDRSLDWLARGHHFEAFLDAYERSRRRKLQLGVHLILGLPTETSADMLATAQTLAQLDLHSLKLHNLYAVCGTPLADWVLSGQIHLPEMEEYVSSVVDFLEYIPESMVIERLCGNAPREYLVAPQWCLRPTAVRTAVEAEFRRRRTRQGSKCSCK